ncbi:MAG: ferritin-like domain-containing protein [Myxococcales bacterium]|nr:ferritin-like domain-containing protein [Myxococcales bacterium]
MSAYESRRLMPGDPLHAVVRAGLQAHGWAPQIAAEGAPWSAERFGLDRVARFTEAAPELQHAIVARCCADQLAEALDIENIGMAFAARMLLAAESVEERQLYATIAADEAVHHAALTPFVAALPGQGPFLELLGRLVDDGDRATQVLVVQVVLEGWGIEHYRTLARTCRDPALAHVLRRIVDDEARHHGSGVVLAPRRPAGDAAVDVLTRFLDMVRVGPQGVLAAVEGACGPLSRAERVAVLEQLDTGAHAASRLGLMRRLLKRAGAHAVVAALEAQGRFQPLTAEEAA